MKSHYDHNNLIQDQFGLQKIYGINFSLSSFRQITRQILINPDLLKSYENLQMDMEILDKQIEEYFLDPNKYTSNDRLNILNITLNLLKKILAIKLPTNIHKKLLIFNSSVGEEKSRLLSKKDFIDRIYDFEVEKVNYINHFKMADIKSYLQTYKDRGLWESFLLLTNLAPDFIRNLECFIQKHEDNEYINGDELNLEYFNIGTQLYKLNRRITILNDLHFILQ